MMFKKVLITTFLTVLFFCGCSTKEEVTIVNEKGKYGALANNNEVIIKPIYDELSTLMIEKIKTLKQITLMYLIYIGFIIIMVMITQ